jgi:NADH:ubiquinone oxidoreductase subunit K
MNFIAVFIVPITLFFIAVLGIVVNRKNVLLTIICVELILLAVNMILLFSSFYLDDAFGQIFAVFILVVAAAESSIGLAILIAFYRINGTISINFINLLNG